MKPFELISSIDVPNQKSWVGKLFLTFDIDWASDDVLRYTLDLIDQYGIKATLFCTHETELLERMRANPNIELGIHPNFNFLLNGDFRYGNTMQKVLDYYLALVPEALCVRSHSLMSHSTLFDLISSRGLKFESNFFIPHQSGIPLKPFMHWDNKLTRVPFGWEDDIHCYDFDRYDADSVIRNMGDGIKIFNFHPIHIFLNTERVERYTEAKGFLSQHEKLKTFKNPGLGTETFLSDLIQRFL